MNTTLKQDKSYLTRHKKTNQNDKTSEKKQKSIVLISKNLLSDLEDLLFEEKLKIKQKKEYLIYFISLLTSLPAMYRNSDETDSDFFIVSLCSQKLKKITYNYTEYFDFLEKVNFIEKIKNYGVDTKQCNQYKLPDKYLFDEIVSYEISDYKLIKKIIKQESSEKTLYCITKRPYLINSFDKDLKIDSRKAFEIIKVYKDSKPAKYWSGSHIITEFHIQNWKYSIKKETDFRLHSSLTRLNKELRSTVTYKGEKLGAIDIRASQPFFFAVFLKAILKKDRELLRKIGANRVLNDEAITSLFSFKFNRENVINFVNLVLSEDFYASFQKNLIINYDENRKPFRMVTNYVNKRTKEINYEKPKIKKVFKTERDYAKSIMMEVLFCSPNNNFEGVKAFKIIYPAVYEIMVFVKKNFADLDKLLSNIEAHCFLDVVAFEFSKKFPNIPIWSIHDSLVTTKSNLDLLHQEVERSLSKVTTIKKQPLTIKEYW